jgi:hypothetical protein
VVARLGWLGGVGVLAGFGLAVEIGDWQRCTGATIGAWLGLVPSEQSSRCTGWVTLDLSTSGPLRRPTVMR